MSDIKNCKYCACDTCGRNVSNENVYVKLVMQNDPPNRHDNKYKNLHLNQEMESCGGCESCKDSKCKTCGGHINMDYVENGIKYYITPKHTINGITWKQFIKEYSPLYLDEELLNDNDVRFK